ncbi:UNVERIFIED_CONTAM: hypothetical protein Scaly_1831900 [Sesamum calycinum]|uniref:Uncharacterized protein n=1 Tax=Sesamum calycinum TaxID=2727403 RepID=A0AAW2NFF7_9LAMI
MLGKFEEASVVQVSRANNATADQLAKLASSMAAIRSRKITFISSERAAIEEPKRDLRKSSGGKALAGKSLRQGFYWPTMLGTRMRCVAPAEVGELNWRVKHYDLEANEQGLRMNLDFVEEVRERASVRAAMYKARMAKAYNSRVRPRNFQVGDLVMRKAEASGPIGKLDSNGKARTK